MGCVAFPTTVLHVDGLGWHGKIDLPALFFPMPPAAAALVFPIRIERYVFSERNPGCLAGYNQPAHPATVYRNPRNGLEGSLVRPHGLYVHQHTGLRRVLVALTPEVETAALVGVDHSIAADGGGRHQPSDQRFRRDRPGFSRQ